MDDQSLSSGCTFSFQEKQKQQQQQKKVKTAQAQKRFGRSIVLSQFSCRHLWKMLWTLLTPICCCLAARLAHLCLPIWKTNTKDEQFHSSTYSVECNGVLPMLYYTCPSWNTLIRNKSVGLSHQCFALYLCKSLLYRSCHFFHFKVQRHLPDDCWNTNNHEAVHLSMATHDFPHQCSVQHLLPPNLYLSLILSETSARVRHFSADTSLDVSGTLPNCKSLHVSSSTKSHQDTKYVHLFFMEVSPCLCSSVCIVTSWIRHHVSFIILYSIHSTESDQIKIYPYCSFLSSLPPPP